MKSAKNNAIAEFHGRIYSIDRPSLHARNRISISSRETLRLAGADLSVYALHMKTRYSMSHKRNHGQMGIAPALVIIILALVIVGAGGYMWGKNNGQKHEADVVLGNENAPALGSTAMQGSGPDNMAPSAIDSNSYKNPKYGFSGTIGRNGTWTSPNASQSTLIAYQINNNIPQAVWVFGSSARSNLRANIAVWQTTSSKPCVPNFTSSMTNKNDLTVTIKDESDAAMGSYGSTYYRGISDGKKEYCVVGQLMGHRHYDLEGKAFDDAEKIDANDVKSFEQDFSLFVDTFRIL